MRTKFNCGMWGTAVLAVAFVLAACGDGGNPSAGGEVVDGGNSELALPVTARYGYLDITVNSLEKTDENPQGEATPAPETHVAVEVAVANLTDEASFELPPDMFVLEGSDSPVRGTTVDEEWLHVERESTTTETLWFVLPEGAAVTDPRLVLNESGYEPLTISLTGGTAATEQVPVAMDRDFEFSCAVFDFGDGVASFNARVTDGGSTRPGPNVSDLGRAAEGEVVVTFDASFTEHCGPLTFFSTRGGAYPVINEVTVGGRGAPTQDNILQVVDETITGYIAAAVPKDSTEPLVFEWWNYETEAAETTSAPLEAIAELTDS